MTESENCNNIAALHKAEFERDLKDKQLKDVHAKCARLEVAKKRAEESLKGL